MIRRFLVLFVLLVLFKGIQAQDIQPLKFFKETSIDTLVDYEHLSFRLFGQLKYQSLVYQEQGQGNNYRYIPKNLNGFGFGFANRLFILDIGFNLKFDKEDFTSRFDFQGTLYLDRHLADLFVLRYTGFKNTEGSKEFRPDIQSDVFNVNYLYNLTRQGFRIKDQFNPSDMRQSASAGGFLVGGYTTYNHQTADSSMAPLQAVSVASPGEVEDRKAIMVGALVGYSYSFLFKDRSFAFIGIIPGIGLQYVDVLTATSSYQSDVFPSGKVLTRMSIGKRFKKSYLVLSYNSDLFLSPLAEKSRWINHTGRLKLVYGFVLREAGNIFSR